MSGLQVLPLAENLSFGVKIRGVARELLRDSAVRRELEDIFIAQGLIVFEDIEQTDAMQLELSQVFGPLKEHPVASLSRFDQKETPGVVEIRTRANAGGVVELEGQQLSHWLPWHFDHCYTDELNRAGVLRAVEIVEEGGITGFADGIALYENFPRDLLAKIEGKKIVYKLNGQYETMRFGRPKTLNVIKPKPSPPGFEESAKSMPRAIHPAVWPRPSGEKVLHISPYMAEGIMGEENPEGDALFEEVCQTLRRLADASSYHHKWRATEMLIWDNLRMLHSVSGNRPDVGRLMYRTTIKGDYGLGGLEADGPNGPCRK